MGRGMCVVVLLWQLGVFNALLTVCGRRMFGGVCVCGCERGHGMRGIPGLGYVVVREYGRQTVLRPCSSPVSMGTMLW
jgi:hypothetical protein